MYDKTKLTEILENVCRLPSGKWGYTHYAIDQGNFIYRLWDEANNVVAEITFSRESDRDYAYALLDLITASPALARQCRELMDEVAVLKEALQFPDSFYDRMTFLRQAYNQCSNCQFKATHNKNIEMLQRIKKAAKDLIVYTCNECVHSDDPGDCKVCEYGELALAVEQLLAEGERG
jgi:hypothetical protein